MPPSPTPSPQKNNSEIAFEPWPSLFHINRMSMCMLPAAILSVRCTYVYVLCMNEICTKWNCFDWSQYKLRYLLEYIGINREKFDSNQWFYCCCTLCTVQVYQVYGYVCYNAFGIWDKFINSYDRFTWLRFDTSSHLRHSVEFDGYCVIFFLIEFINIIKQQQQQQRKTVIQTKIKTKKKKKSTENKWNILLCIQQK